MLKGAREINDTQQPARVVSWFSHFSLHSIVTNQISSSRAHPPSLSLCFLLVDHVQAVREQMDRLSCYQERDGDWTFPKWANTDELKAQTMAICLKNATEEEKASLFKQMDDADAKAEADKLVDDVYA